MKRAQFDQVPIVGPGVDIPAARARFQRAIVDGEPIILSGDRVECLLDFAKPWFANARREFSVKEFTKSVGDEEAAVVRDGYTGNQLDSGEEIPIKEFMKRFWPMSNSKERHPYLAQWEFASAVLDLESATRISEDDDDEEKGVESGLSLKHWRDSKVPVDLIGTDFLSVGHNRLNPFQYLFIGGPKTNSKLHKDTGGMTILIACLVGQKRFTLVHRDDELLLQQTDAQMTNEEISKHPQSLLLRAWECVIQPGEVLAIPPRTFHAVENLTAVVSYSRFHVTCEDLPEWLRSFIMFDSPTLPHEDTIRNAAQWFLQASSASDAESVRCIQHLRDACRVLASRVEGYDETKFWIWITLAEQLDAKLPECQQRPAFTSQIVSDDSQTALVGDVIALLPGVAQGLRKDRRAIVLQIDPQAALCSVRFNKLNFSELVPCELVRAFPIRGRVPDLGPGVQVEVRWPPGEALKGVVQSAVPMPTEGGGMLVQYHGLGSEWNQWIAATDVTRPLSNLNAFPTNLEALLGFGLPRVANELVLHEVVVLRGPQAFDSLLAYKYGVGTRSRKLVLALKDLAHQG
ncbi:hypothetical protein BASA81_008417 [Batrachochytrium salamandrivorans]|nr:hypothetical protein BASA81_008417 [Batrachochytrium salamandrivorans]